MPPLNALLAPDWLPPSALQAISASVEKAYPHEACGVLLGATGACSRVTKVIECQNVFAGDRRHGYQLNPLEHLAILRRARSQEESPLAIYHSHPDGEAELSEADLSGAWLHDGPRFPGVLYCVVATRGAKPNRMRAFTPVQARAAMLRGEWSF